MFCINCGNELSDSNNFCAKCGSGVSTMGEPKQSSSLKKQNELFSRQTVNYLLILWGVLSLGFSIWLLVDTEDIICALFVMSIYFAILIIIYVIIYFWKARNRKVHLKKSIANEYQDQSANISDISLIDFAKEYDKIQVCKLAKSDGSIHSKCVFTKITEVEFSNELGYLTAKEISENKARLFIAKDKYGEFILKSTILQN